MGGFEAISTIVILLLIIIVVVRSKKREKAINEDGIVADAVVSREKEESTETSDNHFETTYTYYVKFRTQDGEEVEALLGNVRNRRLRSGDNVRIKYLPGKTNYAIMDN